MQRISRREALKRLGMGIGVATLLPLPAAVRARAQAAFAESFITLTASEAETLRAIIARLIPADENGPGALEARADRYIDRGLAGALRSSRGTYASGFADVNAQAKDSRNIFDVAVNSGTALMAAAEGGHGKAVHLLLKAGEGPHSL